MKINNSRGDLNDVSAKKEALAVTGSLFSAEISWVGHPRITYVFCLEFSFLDESIQKTQICFALWSGRFPKNGRCI